MHRHNVQSRLNLVKRRVELGIQFALVLVSIYKLLRLFLRLCLKLLGSNESRYQRRTRLQPPLSSRKIGRRKEILNDLQWLERQEVN